MIVVDASVVATALADDSDDGTSVRSRLAGEHLVAPHLIDLEVTSVVRRLNASGHLTDQRARQALDDLTALRLDRAPHLPLIDRCWELRANVTVYDASYVALAEALGATLVTADAALSRAPGLRCAVELLS